MPISPRIVFPAMLAAVLASGLWAAPAVAQPSSADAARLLYNEAQALFKQAEKKRQQGDDAAEVRKLVDEACGKFAAAREQMSGLGITINLARCRERQGRTASAWFLYKDALVLHKRAAAQGEKKEGRQAFIEGRIAALEPELPYLTVMVAEADRVAGMQVHHGDVELQPALWGSEVPIDPGTHQVRVTAPGHRPYQQELTVKPRQRYTLRLPRLQSTGPTKPSPQQPDLPAEDGGMSGGQIGALVMGGVGVAAVAVGAAFGGIAMSQWSEAQELCPASPCSDVKGAMLDDDARTSGNVSTGLLASGGALVGGAVILWFVTAPAEPESAPGTPVVQLVPLLGPRANGLLLHGRF